MNTALYIALGGACGALGRHALVSAITQWLPWRFPFGTLTVNLLGSLLIGVLYVLIVERLTLHPDWRQLLMVGFLGAFTTFSTFSLDLVVLIEAGRWGAAAGYLLLSVGLCVTATAGAMLATRTLLHT